LKNALAEYNDRNEDGKKPYKHLKQQLYFLHSFGFEQKFSFFGTSTRKVGEVKEKILY
jgi:hypothetical protein